MAARPFNGPTDRGRRGRARPGEEGRGGRERRECAPASSESSGSVGAAAVRVGWRPGGRAESGIGARRRRPDERPKKVGQIR